jgi:hypothetical protein
MEIIKLPVRIWAKIHNLCDYDLNELYFEIYDDDSVIEKIYYNMAYVEARLTEYRPGMLSNMINLEKDSVSMVPLMFYLVDTVNVIIKDVVKYSNNFPQYLRKMSKIKVRSNASDLNCEKISYHVNFINIKCDSEKNDVRDKKCNLDFFMEIVEMSD